MVRVHRTDGYAIYRYDAPMSNFIRGSGVLELDYRRIRIRDASAVDGDLVLKMHWAEGMRVDGAAGAEPYAHGGFPVPFVRIHDPEREVTLWLP